MMHPEATDLQNLSTVIIGLSSRPEDAHQLMLVLTQSSAILASRPRELLKTLNYREQTIGCLWILWSWRDTLELGDPEWLPYAMQFLKDCDKNALTVARGKFLSLARNVKKQAIAMDKPHIAIASLLEAVLKFSPTPDHLSPLHADFFQICLLSHNYNAAKDVLFTGIYETDPVNTFLTPTDFLLYCYYGGRLCIGLKCLGRALELLLLALVAPTLASNAITLMIYKLYCLVSLLENRKVPELPRYTSGSVQRLTRMPSMAPYLRLVEAYERSKQEEVRKIIEEAQDQFHEDGCAGLVEQVVLSLPKRDIKASTRCYLTRSLADIAISAGLSDEAEAEHLITQLIEERYITARISTRTRVVTFMEDADIYSSQEGTDKLNAMVQEVIEIGERMHDIKDNIELDPEYRSKVLQIKQHSKLDC